MRARNPDAARDPFRCPAKPGCAGALQSQASIECSKMGMDVPLDARLAPATFGRKWEVCVVVLPNRSMDRSCRENGI